MSKFPCRLWLYVALKTDVAIILRRGPDQYSRLTVWDISQDKFTHGQWLKANIDTHCCDISPSGDYFLYSVKYAKREPYLWVTLSRPPYFSALALWPISDAWGGDSTFVSADRLCIKPGMNQSRLELAEGFYLKNFILVEGKYNSDWRWMRDGWQPIIPDNYDPNWGKFFLTWEKADPSNQYVLRRYHVKEDVNRMGYGLGNAFSFLIMYQDQTIPLMGINCADWDHQGRLIMTTRAGSVKVGELDNGVIRTKQLLDFNEQSFEEITPTSWATSWCERI